MLDKKFKGKIVRRPIVGKSNYGYIECDELTDEDKWNSSVTLEDNQIRFLLENMNKELAHRDSIVGTEVEFEVKDDGWMDEYEATNVQPTR